MTLIVFCVLVHESKKVYLDMYLEERVEQLEVLSVDQGKQIETIARGLADLTVTVNHRFDQVDKRFDRVEADIATLKENVSALKDGQARLEETVADLKNGQMRLEEAVSGIQQTQQVIVTILQDRFK